MAAAAGLGAVPQFVPDVVRAHDWQAGLAAAYLHYAGPRRPATVMAAAPGYVGKAGPDWKRPNAPT